MVYIEKHLNKYPKMQIQDVIKLYLQGILGPAHLISDKDVITKRINDEYLLIENEQLNDEMIEKISDEFIRVYIKPYYLKYKSFDNLVSAFIKSSKVKVDVDLFIKEINKLKDEENKEFIETYLNSKNYLISHSKIYKENYNPHYVVIHLNYKKEAFYEI